MLFLLLPPLVRLSISLHNLYRPQQRDHVTFIIRLHRASSVSDLDAFNQSETTYKGNVYISFVPLYPSTICITIYLYLFFFQLLRARTSMIKRVRSVGKSSKTTQSPRS